MLTSCLLALGIVVGAFIAFAVFQFNAHSPLRLGPVPFFAGLFVAFVCSVALIARLAA